MQVYAISNTNSQQQASWECSHPVSTHGCPDKSKPLHEHKDGQKTKKIMPPASSIGWVEAEK